MVADRRIVISGESILPPLFDAPWEPCPADASHERVCMHYYDEHPTADGHVVTVTRWKCWECEAWHGSVRRTEG